MSKTNQIKEKKPFVWFHVYFWDRTWHLCIRHSWVSLWWPLAGCHLCLGLPLFWFWWMCPPASEGSRVQAVDQSGRAWLRRGTTVQREMAPSSKTEKDDGKQKAQRKHKDHVVKLLMRGKVGMNPQHVGHEKTGWETTSSRYSESLLVPRSLWG